MLGDIQSLYLLVLEATGEVKIRLRFFLQYFGARPRGTALHVAVKRGYYEIVKPLFERDISHIADLIDIETKRSPIRVACTMSNTHSAYNIADLLFQAGASADILYFEGNTALQEAFCNAGSFGNYKLVRLLIKKGATIMAPSAPASDGRMCKEKWPLYSCNIT